MKPFMMEEDEWFTYVIVGSNNSKTGNAVTTYHLPKLKNGESIFNAIRDKNREPCPASCARSLANKTSFHKCYARRTPLLGLSSSLFLNRYDFLSEEEFVYKLDTATRVVPFVRLGGYGDPTFTPVTTTLVLDLLDAKEVPCTGYIHTPDERFKGRLVLSIDNPVQLKKYKDLGWQCALVVPSEEGWDRNLYCDSQVDGITTCGSCKKCNGKGDTIIFKEH